MKIKENSTLYFMQKVAFIAAIFFVSFNGVFAQIKSYKKVNDGVLFSLNKGLLKIKICKEDIVEVKYTILDSFSQKKSLVVNKDWPSLINFDVKEEGKNIIIKTSKLLISINKENEAINYADLNGNLITKEDDANGKK